MYELKDRDYLEMAKVYHKLNKADCYLYVFLFKGNYWQVKTLDFCPDCSTTPDGKYKRLRFRPSVAQKKAWIEAGKASVMMSEDDFNFKLESWRRETGKQYNKGEFVEYVLRGYSWVKDSTPFWEAGDITIDGVSYQVKGENATYIHWGTMENLRKVGLC